MAKIAVTPEMVQKAGADMQTYNGQINARVTALMGQLEALGGGWQGPAGKAFIAAHAEWDALNAKHNAKLEAMGQALNQTAKNQLAMDQANADGNNRFRNIL